MLDWLSKNAVLIQTLTNIVMALIWLAYLQVIVSGVLRQRRPLLSINRGAGQGLDAHLLLTNLGHEPVYIRDVLMTIHSGTSRQNVFLTDRHEYAADDLSAPLKGTLQGPMESGAYMSIGTVQELFDRGGAHAEVSHVARVEMIEIIVLGVAQKATGARKSFQLIGGDDEVLRLKPKDEETERLGPRACRAVAAKFGSDV